MRCVELAALLIAAPLAVAGCAKNPADEPVDGWALTRAALTNGTECFAGRAEYCITDPEFVDGAIKPRLDDLYGGEMPMKRLKVDGTIRYVKRQYRRDLMKPDSITRIEDLVRERYQNPKIVVDERRVSANMGVVPGRIEPVHATLGLRMTASEMVEDGVWIESEAHRVLGDLAARHPDVPQIRAVVTVVSEHGFTTLTYRYLRRERRVVVTSEDGLGWSSARVADDASLEKVSLRRDDLASCRLTGPVHRDDERPDPPKPGAIPFEECPALGAD